MGYFNILNPGKLILYFDDADDGNFVLRRRCIFYDRCTVFSSVVLGCFNRGKKLEYSFGHALNITSVIV